MAPWERQAGETYKAYAAFLVYRDLPLDVRSIALTADKLGKSKQGIQIWSSKYKWRDRVLAYDAYLSGISMLDRQKRLEDMNKRHVQEAQAFQIKAMQALKALDINDMSPKDVLAWTQVAIDIERRALDVPTEVTRQETTVHHTISPANETPEEETNRMLKVVAELQKLGVLNPNGNLEEDYANAVDVTAEECEDPSDTKVDEVHSSDADPKTDRVPPA